MLKHKTHDIEGTFHSEQKHSNNAVDKRYSTSDSRKKTVTHSTP